jgi:hypothetical protein
MSRLCAANTRILQIILAALVACAELLASPAMPVQATYPTCATPPLWFAGFTTMSTSQQWEGASAHMSYKDDNVCTSVQNNTNLSTSWSMIQGSPYGANAGYAQSGRIYYPTIPSNCMRHFGEQSESGSSFVRMLGVCTSSNENHQVWQQYIPSNGHLRSNIDTTVFLESSWSPVGIWPTPWQANFLGETHYGESDVPGLTSNPTDFTQMQVQRYSDDLWESTCSSDVTLGSIGSWDPSQTYYRYSQDRPACDHVREWTI